MCILALMSDSAEPTRATVRWAIIGCGDIAEKRVAPAINQEPNSELYAVVRRHKEKAQDFARRHGATKAMTSFAEAVADDAVDAFYIATPVDLHAPQTIAATLAGKHVLCEKPMALSRRECEDMIRSGKENRVKIGIAYYRRFYEIVRRTRGMLEDGTLGVPRFVRAFVSERFRKTPEDEGYWRVDPEQSGGGPLQDIGSHRLDLMLSLFGRPREVWAVVDSSSLKLPVEDHAHLILQFDNGVEGVLNCCWNIAASRDEWEIHGAKGSITAPRLNGDRMIVEIGGKREERTVPVEANIHYPLIADFVDAILNDRRPAVTCEQGRDVTQVIEAAYLSASSRRPVEVEYV